MHSVQKKKNSLKDNILGTLGCLVFLGVGGFFIFMGYAAITGFFPEERMYKGEKMPKRGKRLVAEAINLGPNERITYYMSGGQFTWVKEAQVLTNERFVTIYTDNDESFADSFYYGDVVSAELKPDRLVEYGQILILKLSNGETYNTWATDYTGQATTFQQYILTRTPGWTGTPLE